MELTKIKRKFTVIVTGVTGFAGSHLAELLLRHSEYSVVGTTRWRSSPDNIKDLLAQGLTLYPCDITDASSVRELVQRYHPDMIYHLAAQSFVPDSWNSPAHTLTTNIIGELNLFEAVRSKTINDSQPGCKILVAGSSEEYGLVNPNETPILETNELRPMSPYGVSKIGQDFLAYQYWQSYGIKVVRARAFNHTGPRRHPAFVCSNFAKQIAIIEKIGHGVIHVGDLTAVRDFTDVRDTVRAYHSLMLLGQPGEVYNICSGVGHTISSVLTTLMQMSSAEIDTEIDESRLRPSDVPILIGDCQKLKSVTDWEPLTPFKQTLEDLLNYWRERV